MKASSVYRLFTSFYADKKAGVKRTPLHPLKECLEEANISNGRYVAFVRTYGNAPKPVIPKRYRKQEVLAYIAACLKADGEKNRI